MRSFPSRQGRPTRWFGAIAALAFTTTVLSGGTVTSTATAADGMEVRVTTTTEDGTHQLRSSSTTMTPLTDATADVSIAVDPTSERQQITGFGGSLDSSSVANIVGLAPEHRKAVMDLMFSPEHNAYNLMRLSFGCSDFCASPKGTFYTYHDQPGSCAPGGLPQFSIQRDIDAGIVGVAREAKRINPDVRFFASLWSPPAWMKTNNDLNNGGYVKPECYQALATYYRLSLEAYGREGIAIDAITTQNEPTVVMPYPTTQWTWSQQRDFIKILGADLDSHGFGNVELWIQDDNLLRTREFAGQILADPGAARYVDGVGYHDYEGDPGYTGSLGLVSEVLANHPDVTQHLTERSYYGVNGAARLADAYRNGISSYSYWLTFLDSKGEPNAGPLDGAKYPQQFGAENGNLRNWWVNPDYFFYGQWSRHVALGATAIDSSPHHDFVYNAAFRNPDGGLVVVAANTADSPRSIRVVSPSGQITATLPSRSVTTFSWQDQTPTAHERATWNGSASAAPLTGQAAGAALDGRLATRWSTGQAQRPGQTYQIDLGSTQPVKNLSLFTVPVDDPGGVADHPRWYEVYTSNDAQNWSPPLAWGRGTPDLTNIDLGSVHQARYIRIVQTSEANHWWSISEIVVS
ncbi:discoidin domain-containing protein [Arthrobacter sedimenti]|uniref:discoidin domain-containing protein n=1 Tax=Arthrobacter sedimenti TaxID=2694931 RepID=UPI000B356592|nr:discoidin domain-containing protein [Arthrobacter sedimenti]OUM43330.1 hypothetical protein B8W73_05280 [Arthrobacter agilis]